MEELVNLSFKVPKDVHKKLKILSTIKEQSMGDIIINFIQKQKLTVPSFGGKPENLKTTKTGKKKRSSKRKGRNPDADEGLIKERILKHKEDGLSLQKIADALAAEGTPTLMGGPWNRGMVGSLIKKWAKIAPQDAQDSPQSTVRDGLRRICMGRTRSTPYGRWYVKKER